MSSVLTVKQKIINEKSRFVILNQHGTVINDADGYGFKTKETATKIIDIKYKKKLKYNPVRNLVLELIKKDKTFLQNKYESLEYDMWYNLKESFDDEELEVGEKEIENKFIEEITTKFSIDIATELENYNSSVDEFLEVVHKCLING